MKVLMLTWEFPPYKVGGVASHCHDLARALTRDGHVVHVLAYGDEEKTEYDKGITIHRVRTGYAPDIVSWAMVLNHSMQKKAVKLQKEENFELVHAHDWLTVQAGAGLKKSLELPLVFTMHSTETGRAGGIRTRQSKMINDLEWYGSYEATQVIAVGKDFREEVKNTFHVPNDKLSYIPNGVDLDKFSKTDDVRDMYVADWEKLVLFVGRLCHSKGIHHFIHSIPAILNQHPEAKFVIVGRGPIDYYRHIAWGLGLGEKTYFTGFVDERTLVSLYSQADFTVVPSTYEPFGIVALESMAAETPVVASYTGGLKETVVHNWCGLHTSPGDPGSLAWSCNHVLNDCEWGRWMGRNGRRRVENNYDWGLIAKWTAGAYGKALRLW